MLSYIVRNARASALFALSTLLLFLLLSAVPTVLSSSQSSKLATEQSITKFGRGSYDILVRPEEARTEIEKS